MPQVDGPRWRDRRAELDMSPPAAAAALGIPKGTLRNIETVKGRPVSLRVIHRAARLYGRTPEWLQGNDEPAPTAPKDEPKRAPSGDPKGPDPRKNGKGGRGPRRDSSMRAAS